MFDTIQKCNFAIKDIDEVLEIWKGTKDLSDPYIQKLYKQRDEAITAKQRLTGIHYRKGGKPINCPNCGHKGE